MRDEILDICLETLRGQGFPDATAESVRRDPALAAATVELLRDCRPMPVIVALIDELGAVAQAVPQG